MLCELYGFIHMVAKRLLKKSNAVLDNYKMIDFDETDFVGEIYTVPENYSGIINEINVQPGMKIEKSLLYPVENLVCLDFPNAKKSFPGEITNKTIISESSDKLWKIFIKNAQIPNGYRFGGAYYGGYIKEENQWCLPSWIWTNGAIVRYLCKTGNIEKAKKLADTILSYQLDCGGWIVRNDYSSSGVIPELAPNDSAYLANNCFLELYLATSETKYLDAARKTADWITKTARPDGMIWFGFDMKSKEWITDRNIVDTGFTAALFSRLYTITQNRDYLHFLKRFVKKYLDVFYIPDQKCFATAVDKNDKKKGGAFGRGQAWALEGLIPAYEVLRTKELYNVIRETIDNLLDKQLSNGGWNYNLLKPLMGEDAKAVPVIAKSLLDWNRIEPNRKLVESAMKALEWCDEHTEKKGIGAGGIFSYTIEGAIVHHMYTQTALVYASAYAYEVKKILEDEV